MGVDGDVLQEMFIICIETACFSISLCALNLHK
jgi:hypothetical protein